MAKDARFEALDSWRGICAVIVVVFHFVSMMPSSFDSSRFIRNGYLFVDFFFVLSGFVLCHSYRGKLAGLPDLARFAIRRFGRVWPLHAVTLAVLAAAVAWAGRLPHPDDLALSWDGTRYAIDAILPSLLLLNAMNLVGDVWNGPAWSIGAEFYVYLIFALLVLTNRRLALPSLGLSVIGLALVYRWAPDLMNTTCDYGLIRCIAGFFGGVVAYHVYELLRRREPLRASLEELAAVIGVVVFVIYAGENADAVSPVSLAAPLVFGIAVIVFAREQGAISLILHARPFKALGRYSFSIYLVHQPMLILLCFGFWSAGYATKAYPLAHPKPWMGSTDLILIDFVLAVILTAAVSYRFIELPSRRAFGQVADGVSSTRTARGRRLAFD